MKRYIRFYRKNDDMLVGEIPININFEELKERYKKKSMNDPMLYYCYPINIDDVLFYSQFMDCQFDFLEFDYFLECDSA